MHTWQELRATVRRDGAIPVAMVAEMAATRAEAEAERFEAMGLPQDYGRLLEHERTLVDQVAKAALDGLIAERAYLAMSPAARAARQFEAQAELAESAIPPQPVRARALREIAAVCRQASYRQAAE